VVVIELMCANARRLLFLLFPHDVRQTKTSKAGQVSSCNICCPSNQPKSNLRRPLEKFRVPYRSQEKKGKIESHS